MEPFNPQYIQECLSRADFLSAAEYYKQYRFADKTQQQQANQYIAQLERYGGIANAIMQQDVNDEDKDKIAFAMKRKYGVYGDDEYTKTANKYMDSIGDVDDKKAVYMEYTFDDNNAYNDFVDKSGINFGSYDESNPTKPYRFTKNGKPVIRVHKSSFNDSNFFDSLTRGLNAMYSLRPAIPNSSNFFGFGLPLPSATLAGSTPPPIVSEASFTSESYDAEGNLIHKNKGLDYNHKNAWNYIDDAENTITNTLNAAYSRVIPAELMVSGFMCDAERQITNYAMSGQISQSDANSMLERIKKFYDRQLINESLTNYDVFAKDINGDTENLNPITDSKEKTELTKMIRAAIDGNRISYVAGASAGRVGTVITILPELDKEGNLIGNMKGETQIFVPDLFVEDARNLIDKDVNAKLFVEKAEHIAFQHAYNLEAGGRLENFTNEGAIYRDDLGEYFVPSEQVDNIMLYNEMLKGCIDSLRDTYEGRRNITEEDLESAIRLGASKIYYYMNNITSEEDMTSETTQLGISKIEQDIMKIIKG